MIMSTQQLCRACDAPLSLTLVDLGHTPLANSYVPPDMAGTPDASYPLHARVCQRCRLVQVEAVQTPDHIFGHYAYFSSYSRSWMEHASRFVDMAVARFGLTEASKVVEVASNDGYLLRNVIAKDIPALGVEPAANVAEVAARAGVPTEVAFFGVATADRLVRAGHAADLVVANNVLAHVPDIRDFVGGFQRILKPEGVVSIEFPHLLRLIDEVQFDTIYHEHYSYLSLLALERLFAGQGLRVFDVEELPTHGGSLRVFACHAGAAHQPQPGLAKVRADEAAAGLDSDAAYAGFDARVRDVREKLLAFLRAAKANGERVAAYGAAAKGNTLLNYCGVDTELIDYVVDLNPHKQDHLLPGSRLPIRAPDALLADEPDYVLILPWNLKAEIMGQMSAVRGWGGRFVVAIPTLTILD